MVILVDIEQNKVQIYGESGLQEFNITDRSEIEEAIGSGNIYYITGATEMNSNDVLNVLSGLVGGPVYEDETEEEGGAKYFKSNMNGVVVIPDPFATGENVKNSLITFQHKNDCRAYDQSLVDKSSFLKTLKLAVFDFLAPR